uniref:TonB-dependent receptor n=1 Tax=Caulobacter sp. (strain K31) TaxID=366602 RepID=B0T3Q6_CAUSK
MAIASTKLRSLLMGAGSALSIMAAQAHAQTAGAALPVAPQAQPDELTEIVVTAQKREQTLSDVPMSVTAFSGDQLTRRGITDVQGLVKITPGLSYVESGNGVPVYSLRGVGFFETSLGARPSVAIYADEAPLPFASMASGAGLDLERVEVLKGPQGTLFGQNATGGAINYIAAKPTAERAGGAAVSWSRFNTVDTSAYVGGPISDTVGFRIAGRAQVGDDWQRSITRDATLGARRFYQGRALLDWRPSDKLKLLLNANGFQDKSETQAAQRVGLIVAASQTSFLSRIPLMVNYPPAPRDNRAADWDAGQPLRKDNAFYQVSLRGDYALAETLTLTSLTAYSHMKINQLMDQDGTSLTASLTKVTGTLSSFSQEVRVAGGAGPAQFVVGASYARDKSDEADYFRYPYTISNFSGSTGLTGATDLTGRQDFDTKAVFGNLDWDITSQIVAHGGLRYTKTDLGYVSCARAGDAQTANSFSILVNVLRARAGLASIAPLAVGGCVSLDEGLNPVGLNSHLKEDNLSWRAGLDWKPAPRTLVYANVSRGYKSGSSPTLPAIAANALRPVTQESVLAYEAGFKAPLIRRVVDVTGAVFYYDYDDKQLLGRSNAQPAVLGVLPSLVNVPKSRIKGAEFQINAFPATGFRLSLAGTYLDSKVTKDFNNFTILGLPANFKGDAFPYTPKYQMVADMQVDRPISDALNGVVGMNINYRSKTNAGFGHDARLDIDSYTLIDVRAGVRSPDKGWEANVFVRNLTDKYYWTNVARLSDVIRRYAGEPRTYGVQVSSKF